MFTWCVVHTRFRRSHPLGRLTPRALRIGPKDRLRFAAGDPSRPLA